LGQNNDSLPLKLQNIKGGKVPICGEIASKLEMKKFLFAKKK
jgi:hypothetical protein